ncbi:MAG TPA: hypothetical protein VF062_22335 [Candidatus Limnocylindrales bacterium]
MTTDRRRPGCPGVAACQRIRPACGHAARVNGWQELWQAWQVRREAENPGMYPTEVREWEQANPPVTFKDYLVGLRQTA